MSNDYYLLVFKLKNSEMKNKKYINKKKAMDRFKSIMTEKPRPISVSLYHKGKLLSFGGSGSYFNKVRK